MRAPMKAVLTCPEMCRTVGGMRVAMRLEMPRSASAEAEVAAMAARRVLVMLSPWFTVKLTASCRSDEREEARSLESSGNGKADAASRCARNPSVTETRRWSGGRTRIPPMGRSMERCEPPCLLYVVETSRRLRRSVVCSSTSCASAELRKSGGRKARDDLSGISAALEAAVLRRSAAALLKYRRIVWKCKGVGAVIVCVGGFLFRDRNVFRKV
jgi:hypothetical protein